MKTHIEVRYKIFEDVGVSFKQKMSLQLDGRTSPREAPGLACAYSSPSETDEVGVQ